MSGHDKFNQRVLGHVGLCVKSDRISERRLVVLWRGGWPVFRNVRILKREALLVTPSHTFGPRFDMPVATLDNTAPDGYTTVHGYYRFTDIFYEWCVFQRKKLAYAFEMS